MNLPEDHFVMLFLLHSLPGNKVTHKFRESMRNIFLWWEKSYIYLSETLRVTDCRVILGATKQPIQLYFDMSEDWKSSEFCFERKILQQAASTCL